MKSYETSKLFIIEDCKCCDTYFHKDKVYSSKEYAEKELQSIPLEKKEVDKNSCLFTEIQSLDDAIVSIGYNNY